MLKTLSIGLGALAMSAGALAPVAAQAQDYYDGGYRAYNQDTYRDHRGAYADAARDGWNQGPRYYETQPRYYQSRPRYYRNARDYRYNYRCNSGTTGTVIGAIAGGLLGRTIDTRGDRTLGTVLGAGAGALAGNAVSRADNPGYCRR